MKLLARGLAFGFGALAGICFFSAFALSISGYVGPGVLSDSPDYLSRSLMWAIIWGICSMFAAYAASLD